SLNAEAVHIVAAEHGAEILARLAEVHTLRTQLVAIEDNFGLRLVKLQVGVGIDEDAAGESLLYELVSEVSKFLRLARRRNDKVNRETAATRKRGGRKRDDTNAGYLRKRSGGFHQELLRGLLAIAPRLGHHSPETASGRHDL